MSKTDNTRPYELQRLDPATLFYGARHARPAKQQERRRLNQQWRGHARALLRQSVRDGLAADPDIMPTVSSRRTVEWNID